MANEIPGTTLEEMWNLVIGGNDLLIAAYDSTHGYVSGTSEFMSDLAGGLLGTPEILVPTITGGDLVVANDAIAGILVGEFVDMLFVYPDDGIERILVAIDTNADTTDINKEGDGGNMSIQFPGGLLARI